MQNFYTANIESVFGIESDNEHGIESSGEISDRIESHLNKVGSGWIYPNEVWTTYIEDSLILSHEDSDALWDLAKEGKNKQDFLDFIKNYNK